MWRVALLAVIGLVVGCSTLPEKAQIERFGDAVSSSASIYERAVAASAAVDAEIDLEERANVYLDGGRIQLLDARRTIALDVTAQKKAIEALGDYGKALAESARAENVTGVRSAITEVGAAFVALDDTTEAERREALSRMNVLTTGAGLFFEELYIQRLRGIIRTSHPVVEKLAGALSEDMDAVRRDLQAGLRDLEIGYQRNLRDVHAREGASAAAYALFKERAAALQQIRALDAALANHEEVFRALVTAHAAMADDTPDAKLAVERFIAIAKELDAIYGVLDALSGRVGRTS